MGWGSGRSSSMALRSVARIDVELFGRVEGTVRQVKRRFERGLRPRNPGGGSEGGRRPPSELIWSTFAAHQLAGYDGLHHLGGAVADLEADHVAHALLEGQLVRVAVVPVEEQALVDGLHRELGAPPLRHRRFLAVGPALVGQPERAIAEMPA